MGCVGWVREYLRRTLPFSFKSTPTGMDGAMGRGFGRVGAMAPFQIGALLFVVVVPVLVWMFDRRPHTAHLTKICERGLAAALVLAFVGELIAKITDGTFNATNALPMQLCD